MKYKPSPVFCEVLVLTMNEPVLYPSFKNQGPPLHILENITEKLTISLAIFQLLLSTFPF